MKVVELREDYVDMAQDDYWGAVHQMNQAELITSAAEQVGKALGRVLVRVVEN